MMSEQRLIYDPKKQLIWEAEMNGRAVARIAPDAYAEEFGPLFAAAPAMQARIAELEAVLVELVRVYETGDFHTEFRPALEQARAALEDTDA
jgi:hypothetical protein